MTGGEEGRGGEEDEEKEEEKEHGAAIENENPTYREVGNNMTAIIKNVRTKTSLNRF